MEAYYPHNRMFNDIVFEGRNKDYGAYFLRHLHQRNMVMAIFFSIGFMLLLISLPAIRKLLMGKLHENLFEITDDHIVVLQPPPTKAFIPPRVATAPQTQTRVAARQIQYIPPTVQADDLVENEVLPATQTELKDENLGTTNIEGPENPGVEAPANISGVAGVSKEVVPDNKPLNFVEQMPEFNGGYAAMLRYLQANIKYPAIARENGISGRVVVQFVVTAEGKIKDARIVKGIGGGCDQEALRCVKSMPDWKPGKHNGYAVPVTFTLPVSFELK